MNGIVTDDQWNRTRQALRDTSKRFIALVGAVDSAAMATADWTVADTVAHLVVIAWMDNTLLDPEHPPPPVPDLRAAIARTTVDTVDTLNELCLRSFTERDAEALCARLEIEVERLLELSERVDPRTLLSWLGESRLPVSGLLAHLVNEILIHGRDIARAAGRDWHAEPAEAARFFDVFLAGVTASGVGRLQERDVAPPRRRIAVELRSRHAATVVLVLRGDDVDLGEPGRKVDVRIRYDPAALALMLFGRTSRLRAALTGKVVVTGRRPWLLFPFLRAVRFPS